MLAFSVRIGNHDSRTPFLDSAGSLQLSVSALKFSKVLQGHADSSNALQITKNGRRHDGEYNGKLMHLTFSITY